MRFCFYKVYTFLYFEVDAIGIILFRCQKYSSSQFILNNSLLKPSLEKWENLFLEIRLFWMAIEVCGIENNGLFCQKYIRLLMVTLNLSDKDFPFKVAELLKTLVSFSINGGAKSCANSVKSFYNIARIFR